MEFDVNSFMEKAKETIEVVAKTTKKTACVQKKKFDVATVRNKLDKCYKELGKLYFESLESENGVSEELNGAVEAVKEVLTELQAAKQALENEKES